MDIMTTLDSGHSLVQPKQEPQPLSRPSSPSTSDNNNIGSNSNEEGAEAEEEEEEEQQQQCEDFPLLNGDINSDDPSTTTTTTTTTTIIDDNGVVPPMKLHVTLSLSGKKQYRKRKPKSAEDREFNVVKKKKFCFVPKEKVTTRATTPSERLFCRKCNIQLFSYNLFECHTIDHALKSPVSVCVERLHLTPEILEALSYARRQKEREEARIAETIERVVSEVSAEENIGGDYDNDKIESNRQSLDSFDTTKDIKVDFDSSFEGSSSFNQSLEQFQTDMIEELHKQIRRLSEASSTYEDKDDITKDISMDTRVQNESGLNPIESNVTVKDTVIVTNPVSSSRSGSGDFHLETENPYERYCPSVAIIEKEPNVIAPASQRMPVPSVLSAILSSGSRHPPPPPLQSMARMAFSQPPTTHNTHLTQSVLVTKPFGQHQVDNSRPASVIYVDTIRSQLPSIESVVSLAPGYKQPPHYSNITFPPPPTSSSCSSTNNHAAMPTNNAAHDATAHITASGSTCACVNCKDLLEGSLLRQAKILLPGGFVEFFCPICKRRFQRKSSLWRHCRTSNHCYICNMCGSGFIKQDMFEQHRQLHIARLNSHSSTSVGNTQGPPPPQTAAPSSSAASSQEHSAARRPIQPHPQLTSRLNSSTASAAASSSKDDDIIVVAVGKRTTPPVTQNAAARNVANQGIFSGNVRPQKDGTGAKPSVTKSTVPPPSQNINRILKSNEITLTPIRSQQSALGEGSSSRSAVRMPPPPPLHSAQSQPRPISRAQGLPQRFEGPNQGYSQQRPGLQQSNMAANNLTSNIRMSMIRSVRPNTGPSSSSGAVSTMSQATSMNNSLAYAMAHAAQNVRGQLMSSGNRMPQLHPSQMISSRMTQPGGVRMPVWHHPVPNQASTSAQRPQFARPPQLVSVSSGGGGGVAAGRMPTTTQSAIMMRPHPNSLMRPSMGQVASSLTQRRPVHPGHIMSSNAPQNVSLLRPGSNTAQNVSSMQRFARPPYYRHPNPFVRPETPVEDISLKCVHCDATFSNQPALQVHFNEVHAVVLSCRRCNAKFRSVLTLKRHEAVCIEKVRCLKCKQVMHHDQLIAHITEVHYPKGNDGNPLQQTQQLPCSSSSAGTTSSSSSLNLVPYVQPSVNVSWTNVTQNSGMVVETRSMPPPSGEVINTMAIRTPVISSVVSLSRTSPFACPAEVSERPASNPSDIATNIVSNSAETPIVIEDDPVSSVLPTTVTDTNENERTSPLVTEESTSNDQPINKDVDVSESAEATVSLSAEEKLPDTPMELPNGETPPPLEDKSRDENVSSVPSVGENEETEAVTVTPPPMTSNPVVADAQSTVEDTNEDVNKEDDSAIDLPVDTPSPSEGSASPEPFVTSASEKKLICPICDKPLETSEAFLDHIQIHKSDEIYECALCDKTFSSKRLLVLHLRSHMRSCRKPFGTSPDSKRRRLNGPLNPPPPNFDAPCVQSQDACERLVVALFDMNKLASSLSDLRNMGVVGLMSIEDFSLYLSRKTVIGANELNEELPIQRLPNNESTQEET